MHALADRGVTSAQAPGISEDAVMYDAIDVADDQAAHHQAFHRATQDTTRRTPSMPTAARFALSASALPPLADALVVGERIRLALIRCSDGHPTFTGRDAAGRVMRGAQHDHAWFLPADDDADGAVDHVVVYARSGFDRAALRSLACIERVWGHGGPDLTATLVALASPGELGCLRHDARGTRTPQLGTARVWESLTPFVPPRHIKHRASGVRDAPCEQIARLLALHGRPPAQIDPLAPQHATPPRPWPIAWQQFRRRRTTGAGSCGGDVAMGFRLHFDQPVTGPIALGYAAHQGLGQFVAVA